MYGKGFHRILDGLSCFVHHSKTAHCMYVQHVHPELCSFCGCPGHCVRYIMILEIEKNLRIFQFNEINYLRAAMGKKLLTYLEHSHMVLELQNKFLSFFKTLHVQCKNKMFFRLHTTSCIDLTNYRPFINLLLWKKKGNLTFCFFV